ncbi:TetR/AcrR family transcriptional regulator [Sporichthya polymorpha]|uniref:TetR/AcrR family transcriptional regulator n=1 Tax=Sporichthya polymorpha TaxID=35751 RepID=UPI00036C30D0|nr:TetR/AcrR family transcriptional regulator [Sporichthya polymorpha]
MAPRGQTRQKMLVATIEVMRERGAAGVTVDEVLARSGAPRGSVYHHFPAGRTQLIDEALTYAGETFTGMLERAAQKGPDAVLTRLVTFWTRVLEDSDFRAGCPVVPTAGDAGPDGAALTAKAAGILTGWCRTIAAAFTADGWSATEADALATTVMSGITGAVGLCRASRSIDPLFAVSEQLRALIVARTLLARA